MAKRMGTSVGEELGVFNEGVQVGPHISAPFKENSSSAWSRAELIFPCILHNFEAATLLL